MSDSKRIVKNSVFLHLRMLLMIGIALFSSRILLRELGIDNFGLYGVVGGVVAMFSSLRGIFASSIQRFLNFEMGRGNTNQLKKIFSIGVTLHLILSLFFLLLAETVGLWFLNNTLVIQPDRYIAANWVYQFSILASIITIMTVPYDAVIIANERMKAFAYLSILDAFLKLAIIFLISFFGNDKLIFYGFLILVVSLITRTISMAYCKNNFEESKFKFIWDKKLFKQIGTFAGWNFLGNTAFTFSNEGVNLVINIFGGTAINAARSIAYQVRNVMMQFISNILVAVNPHLIKLYSQKKNREFTNLLFFISKISFLALFILCVPIILFADTILSLWLVKVPPYSIVFVQLILIYLLVRAFHNPIDTLFKATGKIKYYQIIESVTLFLNLPLSYLLLKNNIEVHYVFLGMIIIEVVNLILILYLAQRMNELNITDYLLKVIVPCAVVTIVASPITHVLVESMRSTSLSIQSLYFIIVILVCGGCVGLFGFNKREKRMLYNTLIVSLKKRFN